MPVRVRGVHDVSRLDDMQPARPDADADAPTSPCLASKRHSDGHATPPPPAKCPALLAPGYTCIKLGAGVQQIGPKLHLPPSSSPESPVPTLLPSRLSFQESPYCTWPAPQGLGTQALLRRVWLPLLDLASHRPPQHPGGHSWPPLAMDGLPSEVDHAGSGPREDTYSSLPGRRGSSSSTGGSVGGPNSRHHRQGCGEAATATGSPGGMPAGVVITGPARAETTATRGCSDPDGVQQQQQRGAAAGQGEEDCGEASFGSNGVAHHQLSSGGGGGDGLTAPHEEGDMVSGEGPGQQQDTADDPDSGSSSSQDDGCSDDDYDDDDYGGEGGGDAEGGGDGDGGDGDDGVSFSSAEGSGGEGEGEEGEGELEAGWEWDPNITPAEHLTLCNTPDAPWRPL